MSFLGHPFERHPAANALFRDGQKQFLLFQMSPSKKERRREKKYSSFCGFSIATQNSFNRDTFPPPKKRRKRHSSNKNGVGKKQNLGQESPSPLQKRTPEYLTPKHDTTTTAARKNRESDQKHHEEEEAEKVFVDPFVRSSIRKHPSSLPPPLPPPPPPLPVPNCFRFPPGDDGDGFALWKRRRRRRRSRNLIFRKRGTTDGGELHCLEREETDPDPSW